MNYPARSRHISNPLWTAAGRTDLPTARFPAATPPFAFRKALSGLAQLVLWLAILGVLAVVWGVTPA